MVDLNREFVPESKNFIGPFSFTESRETIMWGKEELEKLPRPTKDTSGVYLVRHIPNNRYVYVGRGKIQQRINALKIVFQAEGEHSSTNHDAATKMYKYDPKIENYEWAYINHGEKNGDEVKNLLLELHSKEAESFYYNKHKPKFNKKGSVGI